MRFDQLQQGRLLRCLGGCRDGQMDELDAVAFHHGATVLVVGHDQRYVHRQFLGTPAVQQVQQAMIEFRHHDEDALRGGLGTDGEVTAEA